MCSGVLSLRDVHLGQHTAIATTTASQSSYRLLEWENFINAQEFFLLAVGYQKIIMLFYYEYKRSLMCTCLKDFIQ